MLVKTLLGNFDLLLYIWIGIAALAFPIQFYIIPAYGRHFTSKWGASLPNNLGWILMEAPSLICFCLFYFSGSQWQENGSLLPAVLYMAHYTHRSFIFPFLLRSKGKRMPLLIVFMALFFNLINGSTIGYFLGEIYSIRDISGYLFAAGITLFFIGVYINTRSDYHLISLRKRNPGAYVIPRKGLFKYVTCPNFFGEILEWTGFVIAVGGLPAIAFLIWTLSNLVPRAWNHRKWYRDKFPDFPKKRKVLIPFIF